ncbi:MAG: hypothetical protein AW10_04168 [Candidatus Accumulibacter appositus]|uniref:DUF2955 domain-containing protein n=1 Tax=Candidatus Accumulibacter appositus TaxID=1454003 RepID=A0A011QBW0_9PROT|nr:DUF2955 domain-containing protein [Accumulibacter sp.]EXI76224.1 MAG: hypothetical protein AW10_04168 [Candidatus Accumulibacter appositus]HRF06398.1 DUF2955 domain-containing protein [Accumulibacter sp.]
MTRADKAALRLAIGLFLAVLLAYGLMLPVPFVVCLLAVMMLCKPGPPLPMLKGFVVAVLLGALLVGGVLMVPLLQHYALSGVMLTGAVLYALFFFGLRSANPLTMVLVVSFTLVPVAGVAEQALVTVISVALVAGVLVGVVVNGVSHAFFPDPPELPGRSAKPPPVGREAASWIALRATLIVLPVFVLALSNPSFYLAAIMKTVALAQQAGSARARSAGQELVGSTLMGAWMAVLVWFGLSAWPNLWMLMLWVTGAALWSGARIFGVRASAFSPSFWSNALMTMLILLGPAIEDSASGKDVWQASASRVALFVGVSLYAWATVWALERWRASRSEALFFRHG